MSNRNDMIKVIYNFMNGNISMEQLESFDDNQIAILYNDMIGNSIDDKAILTLLKLCNINISNIKRYSSVKINWHNSVHVNLYHNDGYIDFVVLFIEKNYIRLSSIKKSIYLFKDITLYNNFIKNDPDIEIIFDIDAYNKIYNFIKNIIDIE